jgi:hypothetical protein
MRIGSIRMALALATFISILQWSRPASADVTITGTVGEIGIVNYNPGNGARAEVIRFKYTDLNQTKTCTGDVNFNTGTGYAWFVGPSNQNNNNPDPQTREWYAALLVSKKGATLICTIDTNTYCHITSCTLP